jgi:Zn-dependent protease with chaperone function
MDFFEHQDRARKNTLLLVCYFVIAVVCIIVSVYFVPLLLIYLIELLDQPLTGPTLEELWDFTIFMYVTLGTFGVVVIGSIYKIVVLAKGGSVVAKTLGGRLILPDTTDPDERKLRNVIEEMSIASGVPVPKIYLLGGDTRINAFAAGHSPNDAAIGVTRGCLTLLSRDELQGVIGHEFSHILNGDMRLNLRTMGVIFGILGIATIGRILVDKSTGLNNPFLYIGLTLLAIGSIGTLFSRLIQAALGRQREFLADASSVQFTRYPEGLSGALQKIGGIGSQLASPHTGEAGHLFFGNGLGTPFFEALTTHPPLDERIRAIDPNWDGTYPKQSDIFVDEVASHAASKAQSRSPILPLPGMPDSLGGAVGLAAAVIPAESVLPSLGNPTAEHLRYAETLRGSFSDTILTASRSPLDVTALIYALLLSPDEALRSSQLVALAGRATQGVIEKIVALWPEVSPVAARARLPLVNLALPALRNLPPEELQQFCLALQWLIESDGQIDLFEFVLQKIIRRHLLLQSGKPRLTSVRYHSLEPLVEDCSTVLSALANVSSSDAGEVEKAFRSGEPYLGVPSGRLKLLSGQECSLSHVDTALDRLSQAAPQIKKSVIEACVHIVGADGVIVEREAELLRAIAETLDCPIPPYM